MCQAAIKHVTHLTALVKTAEEQLGTFEKCTNLISEENSAKDLEHMRNYGTKYHICRTATQHAFQACTDLLTKTPQVPHSQQDAIGNLRTRIDKGSVDFIALSVASKKQHQKELRKINALQVRTRRAAIFEKYALQLNTELQLTEVQRYAKDEFNFTLSDTANEAIFKRLAHPPGGVPKSKHHELKMALGIAQAEVAVHQRVTE